MNGIRPQDIHIGEHGLHIDSEDLPFLIQALSKILAFVASMALLGFGGWLIWLMHDATAAGRIAVLAIGVVLAATGVLLLIALLLPNAPVTRTVFDGIIGITKAILTPFLRNKEKAPIDPPANNKRTKKPVRPKAKTIRRPKPKGS